MAGTTAFVIVLGAVCAVGMAAVIAKARVEIARIDARTGQRKGDLRR